MRFSCALLLSALFAAECSTLVEAGETKTDGKLRRGLTYDDNGDHYSMDSLDKWGNIDFSDSTMGGKWGGGGGDTMRWSGNVCEDAEGTVYDKCTGFWFWKSCTPYTCDDLSADTCGDYSLVEHACPKTCSSGGECQTIVDIADNTAIFSILVAALKMADLVDVLQTSGMGRGFTVLAPTDEAFGAFPQVTFNLLLMPEWKAHLKSVLLYHVASGEVFSTDLTDGLEIPTLNGEMIEASTDGSVGFIDAAEETANVILADIEAKNGVIHGIDKVLYPKWVTTSVVDLAVAATLNVDKPELTTLVALLKANDLVDLLSSNEEGPFTVFAPTDEAFAAIADVLDGAVDSETVLNVLKYHVVSGIYLSTDLKEGDELLTLSGQKIMVTSDFFQQVKLNGNVDIAAPDNLVNNGVVHLVSSVLLPPSITDEEGGSIPCADKDGPFLPKEWWNHFWGKEYSCNEITASEGTWGSWDCLFIGEYCPKACGQCAE